MANSHHQHVHRRTRHLGVRSRPHKDAIVVRLEEDTPMRRAHILHVANEIGAKIHFAPRKRIKPLAE